MKSKRRFPTLSRTACAFAVTGLLIVPLAFYGAPALAKSAATAHHHGGGGLWSGGGQYSSQSEYSSGSQSWGDNDSDDQSASDRQYGGDGHSSGGGQSPSSSQYQYTPPTGCGWPRFHNQDGLLSRFRVHGHRSHHNPNGNLAPCSPTANPLGGNGGDDQGGEQENENEGSGGGGSSNSGQGLPKVAKF